MTTWLNRIVGIIGYRSIQGGSHLVKPPRLPLVYGVLSQQQHQQQQERTLSLLPSSSTDRQDKNGQINAYVRSFWTWRGGDDKKWKYNEQQQDNDKTTTEDKRDHQDDDDDDDVSSITITEPVATKETGTNKQSKISSSLIPSIAYPVSVCTAQGLRSYMEDEYFLSVDGNFAAVFDGHGGPAVSRYLKKNLYANVQANLPVLTTTTSTQSSSSAKDETEKNTQVHQKEEGNNGNQTKQQEQPIKRISSSTVQDYEDALASALDKVDREVQRIIHWSFQGSTAVAIWIHEERNNNIKNNMGNSKNNNNNKDDNTTATTTTTTKKTIIAANIGDSRAVLCRDNNAWDLTRDHKPDDPLEKARIEALGGQVVWCGDRDKAGKPILEQGIYRVNGNLALSRAIGDRSERPAVTAEAEIISVPVIDEDDFIIIATDGLWDVFDSDDAVDFVISLRDDGHPSDKISALVVEEALRRGTYDNITVVIIWLDRTLNAKQD